MLNLFEKVREKLRKKSEEQEELGESHQRVIREIEIERRA